MEKYELYYLNILIANFWIDDENNIKYVPVVDDQKDIDFFNFLKEEVFCPIVDFPFIHSRILNTKKFKLDTLQYQNSNYLVKRIE